MTPSPWSDSHDHVSVSCDDGAHERCPGCACACHTDPPPVLGGAGGAPRSRRRRFPAAGAGSLIAWDPHHDPRVLIQVLSAAIPGAFALALLGWCIILASQGVL